MDGYTRGGWLRSQGAAAGNTVGVIEPRRNRDSLFLLARVRLGEGGEWMEVRVRNLSAGGLMAEIATPLAIDMPVALELRGIGAVTGRVAWQAEGRTGIAFDVEIDPMKARKPVGPPRATPLPPPIGRR